MKTYDKYKPSGIDWIGDIPEHWKVKKLKFSDEVIMGQSPNSSDYNYVEVGFPFIQGNAEFTDTSPEPKLWCESASKFALLDDILLSVRAPVGAVNLANQKIGIGRGLCALRVNEHNNKFLYYFVIFLHDELNSIGTGSTYLAVTTENVKNTFALLPPIIEQTAIAEFLDEKTAQIDKLIANKLRLIELLKEERTAIINQAVTRGINPHAKLKPSGIAWLGDIPEHWEVKKLKYLVSKVGSGITPSGGASVYQQEGIPLLRSQNIHSDKLALDDVAYITKEIDESMSNSRINEDDVLLNITGASIGRCYFVPKGFGRGNVNQHVCIIRPIQSAVKTEYLHAVLVSGYGQNLIDMCQTGANREGLNFQQIRGFDIPICDTDEQKQIVEFIEAKTQKIDATIEKIELEIKLLNEYRTALISEVVTGKIKMV